MEDKVKISEQEEIDAQQGSIEQEQDYSQVIGMEEEEVGEDGISEEESPIDNDKQLNLRAQEFKEKQGNRGVCYLSRIPPYMKPNYIKRLLQSYKIERVYLLAENEWTRKNRVRRGGNKKICFREGWVEFQDKRMAKLAALTLNGQKMVSKKGNFYFEDLWNLKYLPKFKWHHLTERLAHEQRLKRQRLKVQLQMQRKLNDVYSQKLAKSKVINGMVNRKALKGKAVKFQNKQREFRQVKMAPQIEDE